jgi:hypothetical protein
MNFSSKLLTGVGAVVMSAGAVLFAQGGDAAKVLADMRQALGGDQKLAAMKSLSAVGRNDRAVGERTITGEYEMAFETPDRYFTKQVITSTPMGNVSLTSGFNGNGLIQDTEMPQAPGGGGMRMIVNGAPPNASPEERLASDTRALAQQKQEFARMALGILGNSTPAFPLQFTHGGVAESPDGKADIINVIGEGDFAGKLFVDQKTHLPLMFSWMAKEPVSMVQSSGPGRAGGGPGGANVMTFGGPGGASRQGGTPMTAGSAGISQEDRDKMMADMQERMKEAEAKRKTVEFRVFYGNYQDVDGIKLPHSFQQSIAGNAASEITIEKYKINPKIDPKRFEPKK